jgi:hypothetical protein
LFSPLQFLRRPFFSDHEPSSPAFLREKKTFRDWKRQDKTCQS